MDSGLEVKYSSNPGEPIPSMFLPFLQSTLNFQLFKTLKEWEKPNPNLPNR